MIPLKHYLLFYLMLNLVPASFGLSPNVILITLDTTRADRMGFLGSTRHLTPNLDGLARESVVFLRSYAHVPLTGPSHATILTGTYPQYSQVRDMGDRLSDQVPYLPAILQKQGYVTAAFVGSQVLDPKGVAAPGFDRGFGTYDAGFHSRMTGEDRYHSVERRATEVVSRATIWLSHHRNTHFFLWMHLYDPHDPYDPPPPFKTEYAKSPYDGEIAYTDYAVGGLLKQLKVRGLYEKTLIVVVADHGEGLGEHGEKSHGFFLYDETIHVPLLIKLPAERNAGARVTDRVGLIDIAPTILRVTRIDVPAQMQGSSLLSLCEGKEKGLKGDSSEERLGYAETDYPYRAFGWSALRALRSGKYTYIEAPERELYDQWSDPGSIHNLATDSAAVADTMASRLENILAETSSTVVKRRTIDAKNADQLEALGYISATAQSPNDATQKNGADAKVKIDIANLLHAALLDMEDDRYQEAVPKFERILELQPDVPLAVLELGRACSRLRDYPKALRWLRRAVELSPESGRAHFELGMAFTQIEDWSDAAPQLETALTYNSDSSELEFDLATVYQQLGRTSDAAGAYQAALKLDPNEFKTNLFYGRLLGMQGNALAALPYLRKAVDLDPLSPDGHKFLANIYSELGRSKEAEMEQKEAMRLTGLDSPTKMPQ